MHMALIQHEETHQRIHESLLMVKQFMSFARSNLAFSIERSGATLWPITVGFATSPFGMDLYHVDNCRENRLHGSARTTDCWKGEVEKKYINIAASSDKTGPSGKTICNDNMKKNKS